MSAVALITDLFFVTRVKGTADAIGVPLQIARTQDAVTAAVSAGADLVIVDMNAAGVDPAAVIRLCKSNDPPPRVIAYLSHIQQELADAARTAGADLVLPRSRFSADLVYILSEYTA